MQALLENFTRNFVSKIFAINRYMFEVKVSPTFTSLQFDYIESYLHNFNVYNKQSERGCKVHNTIFLVPNSQLLDRCITYLKYLIPYSTKEGVRGKYYSVYRDNTASYFWNRELSNEPIYIRLNSKIYIICMEELKGMQRYALRVIRDIFIRCYENDGAFLFHAAAFSYNSNAVLLLGNKGAGKSTLLCNFLNSFPDLHFLSNDRIFIEHNIRKHHYILQYVPLAIRLSYATINSFNILSTYLKNNELSRNSLPMEKDIYKEYKAEFTPFEFTNAFQITRITMAKLVMIIIPDFRLEYETARITNISHEEAQSLLKMALFTPYDEKWIEPWLVIRNKDDKKLIIEGNKLVNSIDSNIQIKKLSFGPRIIANDTLQSIYHNLH